MISRFVCTATILGFGLVLVASPSPLAKEANGTISLSSQEVAGHSISDGLVAYYPFTGNANDESGNGNHGTVYGASLATDRFGNVNSAYNFDGVDDYIEIADSASLDINQQITIAAWALFHSNPDGSSRIVDKSHTSCGYPWNVYSLRMCCGANQFSFDVTTNGASRILNSGGEYSLDVWHFIVGTYDGSVQRLYVDGVLDNNVSVSGSIATNNEPLLIGKHRACGSQHFDGVIDELRIYDRALNEAEIQVLYGRIYLPLVMHN